MVTVSEDMAACGASSSWPAGAGVKPSGNPVEPPIVLSLLTAWNLRMQQLVVWGCTPHTTVRGLRRANVGPAGAPLPVASVVMMPVWRSSMNSVRAVGGTMSPFSFGRSCMRSNSMYRPSIDSPGWSSSAAVFTPAGSVSLAPVLAFTSPISKPLPVS